MRSVFVVKSLKYILPDDLQIFNAKNNNNDEIKEFRAFYKYFNVRINAPRKILLAHVNFLDFYIILNDILPK